MPEQTAALRERIAQANQRLKDLYPQLLTLTQQSAEPLLREWQGPQTNSPLHDAYTSVEMLYLLDKSDPRHDQLNERILGDQSVLYWTATVEPQSLFDEEEQSWWINHNWLDHPHPWMTEQCWLAHDLLESNDGRYPMEGLASLLRVRDVHVNVHAVRSYVFDMEQGRFVGPVE